MAGFAGVIGPQNTRWYYQTGVLSLAGSSLAWSDVGGSGKAIAAANQLVNVVNFAGGDATANFITATPLGTYGPIQVSDGATRNAITLEIPFNSAASVDQAFRKLAVGTNITFIWVAYSSDTAQTAVVYQTSLAASSPVAAAGQIVHQRMELAVSVFHGVVDQA